MKEIWKDIPKFEDYQVSNKGRVKRKKRTIITKQNKHCYYDEKILKLLKHQGYFKVCLSKNCEETRFFVHKLVAELFLDKKNFKSMPNENRCLINFYDLQINHKDENGENNRIDNLEYCTRLYNCNYGTRNKRISLNSKKKKKVLQYDKKGNFIKEWTSEVQAKNELKISHIHSVCLNKRKTAGGFIWKFKEENNVYR